MTARIDVHLLTLNEPEAWRQACIESLSTAPIRLHVLPGIAGDLRQARARGFLQGALPLVSFVDPDDLYEPSAFARLADALEACASAVLACSDEALIDEAGQPIGLRQLAYSCWWHARQASHVHGLIVMRRSAVEAALPRLPPGPHADWLLTRELASQGRCLHLPIIGRHWRQHPYQAHRLRSSAWRT